MTRTGEKKQQFRFGGARVPARWRLVPLLVILLLPTPFGRGFAASVRAQVDRTLVQVGDSVRLEVVVSDSGGANIAAQIPTVNG